MIQELQKLDDVIVNKLKTVKKSIVQEIHMLGVVTREILQDAQSGELFHESESSSANNNEKDLEQ